MFTAYNVKTKRKETMVNPALKTITLKHGRGTRYQLVATGAHGMKLFRFISAEQAASFRGRKSSTKRRSHTHKRKTTGGPKRRTTHKRRTKRRTSFGLF